MPIRAASPGTLAPIAGTIVVCGYLLFFRLYGVDESFAMLGEQVRDWQMAQRRFVDLPLSGPRSLNSGADIGPAYYGFLWAGRVLLEPVLGNFPHTGAWAISLLQTAADALLIVALWRRLHHWLLAALIVLATGSSPLDAGLNASVWNPPVAVACVKLAMAALLWSRPVTAVTASLAVLFGGLAVQMHLSALVAGVPIGGWALWRAFHLRRTRAVAVTAVAVISAAGVLLPYVLRAPDPGASGGVIASVTAALADPAGRLRPIDSARSIGGALSAILFVPVAFPWLSWLFAAGAMALVLRRAHAELVACSAMPLVTAGLVFSLWQGEHSEQYWFLVIAPAAAICLIAPFAAMPWRAATAVGAILLVAVVALQPARAAQAWSVYRLPAYGPLAEGARRAAADGRAVRAIAANFEVPSGMDPLYLFALAGGRLDHRAQVRLVIQRDGGVRYEPIE